MKIHRCLPPPSPPQSPNIVSPHTSPVNLWHSHFPVTLLLILLLLLLSIGEEYVSLTTSPSFPRHLYIHCATAAPSNVSCLCLFPLCSGCFGFLRFSLCVYISVLFVRTDEAVLAKAVCFHYFQPRLEILIHSRALREPKKYFKSYKA